MWQTAAAVTSIGVLKDLFLGFMDLYYKERVASYDYRKLQESEL